MRCWVAFSGIFFWYIISPLLIFPCHMAGGPTYDENQQAMAFQSGEERALEYFFEKFHGPLTLYAFQWVKDRQVAEEMVSEAFVKTWQKHHKLGSYVGIRAYLYTIVRRDSARAAARMQRERTATVSPALISPDNPFQYLVRAETCRLVHAALDKLSSGNRQVITLHYLEGKSMAQIARQLNLRPKTVRTRKARGIRALLKFLQPVSIGFLYFFERILFLV